MNGPPVEKSTDVDIVSWSDQTIEKYLFTANFNFITKIHPRLPPLTITTNWLISLPYPSSTRNRPMPSLPNLNLLPRMKILCCSRSPIQPTHYTSHPSNSPVYLDAFRGPFRDRISDSLSHRFREGDFLCLVLGDERGDLRELFKEFGLFWFLFICGIFYRMGEECVGNRWFDYLKELICFGVPFTWWVNLGGFLVFSMVVDFNFISYKYNLLFN